MTGPQRGLPAEAPERQDWWHTWVGHEAHSILHRTIPVYRKHWVLRLLDWWNRSP